MKLVCPKCGRQIQVLARDIREMGLNVESMNGDDGWWQDVHLCCPFCAINRCANYWLQRVSTTSKPT